MNWVAPTETTADKPMTGDVVVLSERRPRRKVEAVDAEEIVVPYHGVLCLDRLAFDGKTVWTDDGVDGPIVIEMTEGIVKPTPADAEKPEEPTAGYG